MKSTWLSFILPLLLSSCLSLPRPVVLPRYQVGGQPLCEGVYFNVKAFLESTPSLRPAEVEHFPEIREKLLAVREGSGKQLNSIVHSGKDITGQVWGLVADGVPFIRYEGKFYPITQLGRLSSFFIMDAGDRVTVVDDLGEVKVEKRQIHQAAVTVFPLTDVVETNVGRKRTFRTTVHYLVDMDNGEVELMDCHSLAAAIRSDTALLNELEQKRDKEQVYYSYFLRYNQRHPLVLYPGGCY